MKQKWPVLQFAQFWSGLAVESSRSCGIERVAQTEGGGRKTRHPSKFASTDCDLSSCQLSREQVERGDLAISMDVRNCVMEDVCELMNRSCNSFRTAYLSILTHGTSHLLTMRSFKVVRAKTNCLGSRLQPKRHWAAPHKGESFCFPDSFHDLKVNRKQRGCNGVFSPCQTC